MSNLSISISQLKAQPTKAISRAEDYPLVVKSRNQVKAYLLGKELFEKIAAYLEDYLDKKIVEETDFRQGRDFEKFVQGLDL